MPLLTLPVQHVEAISVSDSASSRLAISRRRLIARLPQPAGDGLPPRIPARSQPGRPSRRLVQQSRQPLLDRCTRQGVEYSLVVGDQPGQLLFRRQGCEAFPLLEDLPQQPAAPDFGVDASLQSREMRNASVSIAGSCSRGSRSRLGTDSTHWQTGNRGKTGSARWAAVSTIRRGLPAGQTPRPLHDQAMRKSWLAWELAEAFWPGPLTLILKRAVAVPKVVTGGQDSVGLRVPAHPLALDLLRAYARAGGGLSGMCGIAAPSANRFGRISPTAAAHVREELGDAVPLILDGGRCPVGIESTILDLTPGESLPPRLLRPGRITHEQIAMVLGVMPQIVTRPPDGGIPRVSGSLAAHYAPTTPLRLVPPARLVEVIDLLQSTGRRCAVLCHSRLPATPAAYACRRLPANPRAYARALYAALRELDQADAELIIVEEIPATPAWAAVADRLQRAAAGAGASGA